MEAQFKKKKDIAEKFQKDLHFYMCIIKAI